MIYRDLLTLTDDEIRYILNDIFDPVSIENIQRDKLSYTITADMTTKWNDFENSDMEIKDEIELSLPGLFHTGLSVDFSIDEKDIKKWKMFLLAKGCHPLLKDNPYLDK